MLRFRLGLIKQPFHVIRVDLIKPLNVLNGKKRAVGVMLLNRDGHVTVSSVSLC